MIKRWSNSIIRNEKLPQVCTWHAMHWQFADNFQLGALCCRLLQKCFLIFSQTESHAPTCYPVSADFCTASWLGNFFIGLQNISLGLIFEFLKLNSSFFFFPSALVVNEEKAGHFHGYSSEYSSIHLLYIWYFMSINKKGAKLGLRLFWRM